MFDDEIREAVAEAGYNDKLSDVLIRLMNYMDRKKWIGACYATASVLYVCLSEIGYNPVLCIGEATTDFPKSMSFDHGWIELDGKIIDLACSMTLLGGIPVSPPIIFDKELATDETHHTNYGFAGKGMDDPAKWILTIPLGEYMNKYPDHKDGLWGVVQEILLLKGSTKRLKEKYSDTRWNYIRKEKDKEVSSNERRSA